MADDTLQLQLVAAPTAQHRAVAPRPVRTPPRRPHPARRRPLPSLAVRRTAFGLLVAIVLAAAVLAATDTGLIARGPSDSGGAGGGAGAGAGIGGAGPPTSSGGGILRVVTTSSTGATYAVSAGAHRLVVSARTPCWVEVSQGSRTLFAAVMPAGGSQSFGLTASTTVQLGSAGGSVTVSGGGGGASRRLTPPAAPYSYVLLRS